MVTSPLHLYNYHYLGLLSLVGSVCRIRRNENENLLYLFTSLAHIKSIAVWCNLSRNPELPPLSNQVFGKTRSVCDGTTWYCHGTYHLSYRKHLIFHYLYNQKLILLLLGLFYLQFRFVSFFAARNVTWFMLHISWFIRNLRNRRPF